jgi:histidine kinase
MMTAGIQSIFSSLIFRLILLAGLVLFVSIFTWAYFNIEYQKKQTTESIIEEVDRLGNTIRLGAHYAMMLNSRDDINEIIKNVGKQEGIQNVRIFNKEGQIKFSNKSEEIDQVTNIKDDACYICHDREPPREEVDLKTRTRILGSPNGSRLLGIISPIYNEATCAAQCHIHPPDKRVLGALDVVISLKNTDEAIQSYQRWISVLAIFIFLATSTLIGSFLFLFVKRPIKQLIEWTGLIAQGEYDLKIRQDWDDEIGQLAFAIHQMGREIGEKQEELNKQRYEYQDLFERVPCYITVQDKDLRMLRCNREFTNAFAPSPGDYCYEIYKGRSEPCDPCPVMMTFKDGGSHSIEETGLKKDGTVSHWLGRTSAIKGPSGEITAVMEMSVDITERKRLEEEIRKSEEKYRHIFNTIPNPVFVLDKRSLTILDCNESATSVYGYKKKDLVSSSFLKLFEEGEHQQYALEIRNAQVLNQAHQFTKEGKLIFVNIRVSQCDYLGRPALLLTTSDITKRLLAEQHLIQASKMATLGEMATGIAHELNQPLTVIKAASSFLIKKVKKKEAIKEEILQTMAEEMDSHVDRASRIINHLREFGRKSEVKKEKVQVNQPLEKALEIFSQQLKLREIEVVKELNENLPLIQANANRLEQVFVNLLINARDAIEEKIEKTGSKNTPKRILLKTCVQQEKVTIEIKDTGVGIPKSVHSKIFEPFFTTKKVGKGTGLGLSISYGIVQDYDGQIRVETTEGEGSDFIIQFPISGEA